MGSSSRANPRTGKLELLRAVWDSKWLLIVAGLWLQSLSGSSYTFGVYSQSIKDSLNYDQQTLDLLGFFKDIGANLGILAGLLYDYLPAWLILILGAAHCFFGYFMIWLAVTGWISPPFWLMCVFIALATNAQTYLNTAVVVTCVETFPTRRGVVIGLQKGLLGLSGAILSQIYYSFSVQGESSFILMVAWLPALMAMLSALRIRPIHGPSEEGEERIFHLFFANALALALYLMVVVLLQNAGYLSSSGSRLFTFGILVILLVMPLSIAVSAELGKVASTHPESRSLLHHRAPASSQLSLPSDTPPDAESLGTNIVVLDSLAPDESRDGHDDVNMHVSLTKTEADILSGSRNNRPSVGDNFTISQALSEWNFWLLFLSMVCAMGSGLTAIDNLGQIGTSLGYEQSYTTTFVSLLSIWNFLGRSGSGFISEHYLMKFGLARPIFIVITLAAMSLGHLSIASGVSGCLYVGSTIIGLCYGAQWALMPSITSEIFGLAHFGILFNTIAIGSPLGAYFFSVKVAGYFYDKEAKKQRFGLSSGGSLVSGVQGVNEVPRLYTETVFGSESLPCDGATCFRLSFLIMAGACLLGCLASTILVLRTQQYYKQEFRKRQVDGNSSKAQRFGRDD